MTPFNERHDEKIVNALITIGAKKSLSKITVSDITKLVKINRGTFYLHYSDKDTLIESIENHFTQKIEKQLSGVMEEIMVVDLNPLDPHPQLINLFRILNQNSQSLLVLMGQNGDPKFISTFYDLLEKNLLARIIQIKGEVKVIPTIPVDYVIHIVISEIIDIIQYWLRKENAISEEAITDIIVRTRLLSPYQLLNFEA